MTERKNQTVSGSPTRPAIATRWLNKNPAGLTPISLARESSRASNIKHTENPRASNQIQSQKMHRREFAKSLIAAGLLTQIPLFTAFKSAPASSPYKTKTDLLNSGQMEIVREVQQYLFPNDGNGPGASQLKADDYLLWVLSDPHKDPADTKYILDGIGWVDETADEEYGKAFKQLNTSEKEELVAFIANEAWGSSWMSIILTYIFEALIADPQYGGNVNESGWKWLNHYPGNPRPTESLLYGNILNTVNKR